MTTKFCPRCHALIMAAHAIRYGGNPNIIKDEKEINFACQIPIYGTDSRGQASVRIWDCKKRVTMQYSQIEWDSLRRDGKL